ncbi:MAG TPA: hypothetical protein VIJ14_11060, partial [Rhabdochlamydiaceae bacterium]
MINPFAPVYNNILLPLATSQIKPYITLYDKSIRPLYNSVMTPCQSYEQAVERYTAFIKTVELAVQFTVYFFLYQKGWHFGTHHLGLPGGAIAFSLIYAAGCWVDGQLKTNMNDICTGTWLYYKGIRNFGTNREAVLASIIVAGHLTRQHKEQSTVNSWDANRRAAAEWIAQCFFDKPQSSPAHRRLDGVSGDAIDGGD